MKRDTLFSYVCIRCRCCCNNKLIQLNPYEVTRLADNQGITTTDFIRNYTIAGGTALKMTDSGDCIFLTADGCGVHPDRPLVCRLYPLGRHVSEDGDESFSEVPPHPESKGVRGKDGSVEDYLQNQGAGPYIDTISRYLQLVEHMFAALQRTDANGPPEGADATVQTTPQCVSMETALAWLDVDLVVSDYCTKNCLEKPMGTSEKMDIHINVLEAWHKSL